MIPTIAPSCPNTNAAVMLVADQHCKQSSEKRRMRASPACRKAYQWIVRHALEAKSAPSHALNEYAEYLHHLLLRSLVCAILVGLLEGQLVTSLRPRVTQLGRPVQQGQLCLPWIGSRN